MLVSVLGVLFLIAHSCPDTTVGRAIRRMLVEQPAEVLNGLTPRRALFLVAVLLFALAFAQAAPPEFVWIAAGDAATWLELAVATWLLAASRLTLRALVQVRDGAVTMVHRASHALGRARAARAPRIRRRRVPAPDKDEGAPWFAYA
jgi:hypothetical protein